MASNLLNAAPRSIIRTTNRHDLYLDNLSQNTSLADVVRSSTNANFPDLGSVSNPYRTLWTSNVQAFETIGAQRAGFRDLDLTGSISMSNSSSIQGNRGSNNALVGFDWVVSNTVVAQSNLEVRTQRFQWNDLFPDIKQGWDIIVVTGQSNAVGTNSPVDNRLDYRDPRIMQFVWSGTYTGEIVQAVDALQDGPAENSVGPVMEFCRQYVRRLGPHRKVLIVMTAVGGTQLYTSRWHPYLATENTVAGSQVGDLFRNMITRVAAAVNKLSDPSSTQDVRLGAVLWVQGESDAQNSVSGANYQAALQALIHKTRTTFHLFQIEGALNCPWLIGSMLPAWVSANSASATPIQNAHIAAAAALPFASFTLGSASIPGGDAIHYSPAGARDLGYKMATFGLPAARAKTDGTFTALPAITPTPATPTINNITTSGATVNVVSALTPSAIFYRVDRTLLTDPTFSSATSLLVAATGTSQAIAITGLTAGTQYVVRFAALNVNGASAVSGAASFTTTVGVLGAPTSFTALTASTTSVKLDWTAVAGATAYSVQFRLASTGPGGAFTTVTPNPTTVTATVTGLTPDALYDFQIATVNGAGTGAFSAIKKAAPLPLPLTWAASRATVGSPLTSVTDLTGNNRPWTTIAGLVPTITTDTIGTSGTRTVVQTTTTQRLACHNFPTGSYTKMALLKLNSGNWWNIMSGNLADGDITTLHIFWGNNNAVGPIRIEHNTIDTAGAAWNGVPATGTYVVLTATYNATTNAAIIYQNKTQRATATLAADNSVTRCFLNDFTGNAGHGMAANYVEWGYWGTDLTAAQVSAEVDRINAEYGLVLA